MRACFIGSDLFWSGNIPARFSRNEEVSDHIPDELYSKFIYGLRKNEFENVIMPAGGKEKLPPRGLEDLLAIARLYFFGREASRSHVRERLQAGFGAGEIGTRLVLDSYGECSFPIVKVPDLHEKGNSQPARDEQSAAAADNFDIRVRITASRSS